MAAEGREAIEERRRQVSCWWWSSKTEEVAGSWSRVQEEEREMSENGKKGVAASYHLLSGAEMAEVVAADWSGGSEGRGGGRLWRQLMMAKEERAETEGGSTMEEKA
ncbi:hypothetical protein AMTR_s00008p00261180 [Amborella trichopoda]|uniref:Uncharacterized protein n=1 Tax=Amborella trichopoda TaxID=13333 RepID=W1NJ15_AMBTC|nr:hypothetical protein AMTR_s00008p00261180 [Amborella trichopoda]